MTGFAGLGRLDPGGYTYTRRSTAARADGECKRSGTRKLVLGVLGVL